MPPSRRSNQCPRVDFPTRQLPEDKIRACLGIPNDSPDPSLFALAATLPVSNFPIDNVHPSVRYEESVQLSSRDSWLSSPHFQPPENTDTLASLRASSQQHGGLRVSRSRRPRAFRKSAAFVAKSHALSTLLARTSQIATWPRNSDGMNEQYWIDQLPALSSPSDSSDLTSIWSLDDSSPGSEPRGLFGLSPASEAGNLFNLAKSCAVEVLCDDTFGAELKDHSIDFPQELLSDYDHMNGTMPLQDLPLPNPIWTPGQEHGFPGFDPEPDTRTPDLFNSSPQTLTLSMSESSIFPPTSLLQEDHLMPDLSTNSINNDADGFLDELGELIDWDAINSDPDFSSTNNIDGNTSYLQTSTMPDLQTATLSNTHPNDQEVPDLELTLYPSHSTPDLPTTVFDYQQQARPESYAPEQIPDIFSAFTAVADSPDEHAQAELLEEFWCVA
jgi:hypothetical protein